VNYNHVNDKLLSLDVSGVAAGKGGTSGECGLHVSPNCDGLPGNELSHREGEDFQPLDVSGVVGAKGVTKGKGSLQVSPPCGRVSGTNSLTEKVKISFNL
jgi:hypothetical protein